ncbi:MAG: hypothetical protein A2725_00745 [Candidatus Magasanikbacteria bacterium RIFCSPHIGHO2_01_FULL_33_34]|uniref:Uncharacterized protein n=1 Tax=Candidatus Magasanikbacteria bacterium RIFCSPHIGHO2_01_FULL_33_34 TaxID=1798671 RepID=A0A1F6LJ77_9BACT|nr:MAG: hypothetical protein A2725_00745 [Candidatus Magasanikbacteria bacterium RIFCSPHIGHO2_01_FULL_33_34]OGH65288.1 MAG: hypothetical protein A3B83_04405 [Candidatus Magasanikbacteria bacterium RIFCSPHIGHO2_02_FULL_33_17]OGH76065.1 MAG: hypothetical protein A3A89_01330 [Candidatus Magasanikbacteria bacterium RIFCSPLOWO2_01_FULL_33_34]OGH81764.1 MAG: hypothetical protein A3F93_00830 [Candidatus Magasanikbacteria bacterium RIFCSPLOWO2_12_FULL_34_7]
MCIESHLFRFIEDINYCGSNLTREIERSAVVEKLCVEAYKAFPVALRHLELLPRTFSGVLEENEVIALIMLLKKLAHRLDFPVPHGLPWLEVERWIIWAKRVNEKINRG